MQKEKLYHFTYQTTNTVNGKIYIGVHSTNNVNDGYMGSGFKIKEAIKKYGAVSFRTDILCFFDTKEDAYEEERFIVDANWVKSRDNYNMTTGGFTPPSWLGRKMSEEAKAKISKANTGRKASDETRKKISEVQKGRVMSAEARAKKSLATKGVINKGKKSKQHLDKIRESRIKNGWWKSDEQKAIESAVKIESLRLKTIEKERRAQEKILNKKPRTLSLEHIEKLRSYSLGKKQSPELIEKRMSKIRGLKRTEEQLVNIRAAFKNRKRGYKLSEAHKLKMSERSKNCSAETREKIGAKSRGRRHTSESIQKMKVVHKNRTRTECEKNRLGRWRETATPELVAQMLERQKMAKYSFNIGVFIRRTGEHAGDFGSLNEASRKLNIPLTTFARMYKNGSENSMYRIETYSINGTKGQS